jgi:zinc transporter ZupT
MIYALLDILEIDMIAGIGFLIFQPILGFILTFCTIIACLIVGLPIRLVKKVRDFWLSKPFLPIAGAATGIIMLFLSFNSNFTELKEVTLDYGTVEKEVPNTTLALVGWFLTAFSLLHFYPQSLLRLIRSKRKSDNIEQSAIRG